MTWWLWIGLGVVLVAVELATPGGYFVIFFGVAALVVGAVALIGAVSQLWIELLLFPVTALIALRLFRQPLLARIRRRDRGADDLDSVVGTVALAAGSIGPGAVGLAELRGTTWSARNIGDLPLAAGQRCRVVAIDGLMLVLRSE
jgi:membrane protein implicated in regulation of membrane protease activity